jgi:hypothetical protein
MNPVVRRAANVVSLALNPSVLTGVFFGVLAAGFALPGRRLDLFIACLLFATVLPVGSLFVLHALGHLSDIEMRVRTERGLVYLVCLASYLAGTVVLVLMRAPWQLWGMMSLHLPTTAMLALLTRTSKVSVHTMVIAGICGAAVVFFGPSALPGLALLPIAAWARWAAGAHSIAELVTGATLGMTLSGGGAWLLSSLLG